jgi:hypothetical protein
MRDFWRASGYALLDRDEAGRLVVTDDFLRAYLGRPEVQPVAESCAAELALHGELLKTPRLAVSPSRIAAIADADAAENYRVLLDFRDRLIAASTVEGCYLSLFEDERVPVPPLFVDQLAQVVLRGMLDGADDPLRARAAELLFRRQKVQIVEGAVLMADEETVAMYATSGGYGSLGELVAQSQTPLRRVELDVLDEANGAAYWEREERHDTVLNVTFGQPGLDALCRVLEGWIEHFLGVAASIQPVETIRDHLWVWHIGLDVEGTAILNDLYNGVDVDEDTLYRILSLFRLEIEDRSLVLPEVAGRPLYLAMAMSADNTLRLKPQNLLVNLPLAAAT